MSGGTIIALVGAIAPFIAIGISLWMFQRDRIASDAAVHERVNHIPAMIEAALLKWEGPFRERLNGTYMRTPLIEAHLKGITEHIGSVQREVTDMKTEIRASVRDEVGNALQRIHRAG